MVLLEQSRHELAIQELRQELLQDPNNSQVHAILALCLSAREDHAAATQAAQAAIANGPDSSLAHHVHAKVLINRHRLPEAQAAIQEAIRLDPSDPDFQATRATIAFAQCNWQTALDAAEAGLELDPEDTDCNNLRAMALDKLGRREQAGETVEATLARDPSNVVSHYVQGMLQVGKHPSQAIVHFSEALRIDPDFEPARAGLVEALKARNFIYRGMLNFFLWCGRLSTGAQWGVMLGGYFGCRYLSGLADRNPGWSPVIMPLLVAYLLFAWMTWLAYPLFNLLLRFHAQGRRALSQDQIRGSNWLAGGLLVTLFCLALWPASGKSTWGLVALFCGICVLPLSAVHRCDRGWPRWTMAGISAAMILVVIMNMAVLVMSLVWPGSMKLAELGDPVWLGLYQIAILAHRATRGWLTYAFLGATIAANYLTSVTPKK
ncbi:MAG: tetratricopeptide repeat protein [Pirellulales bacterium]